MPSLHSGLVVMQAYLPALTRPLPHLANPKELWVGQVPKQGGCSCRMGSGEVVRRIPLTPGLRGCDNPGGGCELELLDWAGNDIMLLCTVPESQAPSHDAQRTGWGMIWWEG